MIDVALIATAYPQTSPQQVMQESSGSDPGLMSPNGLRRMLDQLSSVDKPSSQQHPLSAGIRQRKEHCNGF
jgi:hypothetical protein